MAQFLGPKIIFNGATLGSVVNLLWLSGTCVPSDTPTTTTAAAAAFPSHEVTVWADRLPVSLSLWIA